MRHRITEIDVKGLDPVEAFRRLDLLRIAQPERLRLIAAHLPTEPGNV